MDIFKQQFARIQEQLAGLTATQRMLTGSLVAIMVLTMMLWARYATTADMVPVLNASFDDQQIVHATMALKQEGIDAQVSGDRILVSADKHDQALAILSFNELLPVNSESGFDDIIKMTTPFDTEQKSDLMFTRARAAELSQILGQFPGVKEARVVINPVNERRIGESLKPSAAVSITTRGGSDVDIKHMVESAASTVAAATSGLERSNVSVVVNGHPHIVHDSDSNGGLSSGEVYEQTEEQEQHLQDKIARALPYDNPLIAVSVKLDIQSRVATKVGYDPATSIQKESLTDNQTDENTQSTPAAEPGVAANTGASVNANASASSSGNTTSSEHDKTQYANAFGSTTETITTPSGQEQVLSASVGLPRSHFVEMYKRDNPGAKDPDDEALRKSAESEFNWVRHQVESACGITDDKAVNVDFYADDPVATTTSEASAAGGSGNMSLTAHIKEIAIGALAMLSLFMVSMMVRKGGPSPVALAGVGIGQLEERETPIYDGDDEVTAVVGSGQNAMDGMELDDEAMKSQQVVEQVTTMIKENPDGAASLVKRWLNRT